jgi:hypothetical protein
LVRVTTLPHAKLSPLIVRKLASDLDRDSGFGSVYLFENLTLDAPSEDKVYRAAFFFSPLPVKGATGSPGNPIVVR